MLAGAPGCVVDLSRLRATQPLSDGRFGMRRWTGNRVDELNHIVWSVLA